MITSKTTSQTHDNKVAVAEAVRQAAVTPTATAAAVIAAEKTFYTTLALSAIANGVSPSVFSQALREKYGVGIYG